MMKRNPHHPRIFKNHMICKPPGGEFLPLHLDTNWARGHLANFSSYARSLGTHNWPMQFDHHLQPAFEKLSRPGEGLDSRSNEVDRVWMLLAGWRKK